MSDHDGTVDPIDPLDPRDPADATPAGPKPDDQNPAHDHDHAHQAHADELRHEGLVLLALGEPVQEWLDGHHRDCPDCQEQLRAYREAIELARAGGSANSFSENQPPATLWASIAAELELDNAQGPPPAPAPPAVPHPPSVTSATSARRRVRPVTGRGWLAVAAVLILAFAAAALTGFSVGRNDRRGPSGPEPVVLSQAQLSQQPGGPINVSGAALVHTSASGLAITVDTHGLPLRRGYYQVWLYDPVGRHMVPVGALNDAGHGTFSVPAAVDLRTYDVVDISAQDYGGDYVHKQTVLQGPLTA